MQEGTPAFVTMVKISAAVAAFKDEKLPYIAYLRHPTTGGVFASWGSLGHVTVAEPGAMIGFLGARVYEALYGEAFPAGVQTAENLYAHGLVDAVLPVEALPEIAGRFLDLVLAPRELAPSPEVPLEPLADVPAWDSVLRWATRSDPACGRCSSSAPPMSCRSSAPGPVSGTAACSSPWRGSRGCPAWCSARTGAVSGSRRRSARPACGSHGAG